MTVKEFKKYLEKRQEISIISRYDEEIYYYGNEDWSTQEYAQKVIEKNEVVSIRTLNDRIIIFVDDLENYIERVQEKIGGKAKIKLEYSNETL